MNGMVPYPALANYIGQCFVHHVTKATIGIVDAAIKAIGEQQPPYFPILHINNAIIIYIYIVGILPVPIIIEPYRIVPSTNGGRMSRGPRKIDNNMFAPFGCPLGKGSRVPRIRRIKTCYATHFCPFKMIV